MATQLDALFVEIFFKGDQQALDNFKRGWKELDNRIKRTQQTLDNFSKRFAVAGTVGIATLGLIGKAGLDTEEALLRVRAQLGLTENQMRTLREEALRIGSTLPLNTKDIVDAQLEYGKLGATFEEIIRDAPTIAGAAVATGMEPAQVAQYARIIRNVFGGDINTNLDLMVRLANRGNATFVQLGESLQFSGQSAADAGLDFRTYLAVLGGVAGAGRSVDSVAQGLTGMWARLAKANEDIGRGGKIVMEAFEGVGISFESVNAAMDGTAEGFVNVLSLIKDAELSTGQLTALLSTLAGDTYSASISFAVQNPEFIQSLLREAELAHGEIIRQQAITMSGASGGLKDMKAQIDTLLNRLAEFGTLTAIETFTRMIGALVAWLTKTNEEGDLVNRRFLQLISIGVTALASLLAIAAALKIVSFALGGFTVIVRAASGVVWLWRNALVATRIQMFLLAAQTKLASISTWLNTAANTANTGTLWGRITALVASRAAILAGAVATGVATAAQWSWNAAILANPIGLVIVIIAALVAAIVVMVRNWDWVKATVLGAWDTFKGFFSDMPGWVQVAMAIFLPFIGLPLLIAKNWAAFADFFGSVWNWIVDKVMWAWDLISPIADAIGGIGSALGFGGNDSPNMPTTEPRALPSPRSAPSFAEGGIVPGPLGRAVPILAHAGEMVLPQPLSRALLDATTVPADNPIVAALDWFGREIARLIGAIVAEVRGFARTNPTFMENAIQIANPALPMPFPVVPAHALATGGGSVSYVDRSTYSPSIEITVNTQPGQDVREIAEEVGREVEKRIQSAQRAQWRQAAADFDSDVAR